MKPMVFIQAIFNYGSIRVFVSIVPISTAYGVRDFFCMNA